MPDISMTWPEYKRSQCRLDGNVIQLRPKEVEVLLLCLLRRGQTVTWQELVEWVYPDPDVEPYYALRNIYIYAWRLCKFLPGLIHTWVGVGLIIDFPETRIAGQ